MSLKAIAVAAALLVTGGAIVLLTDRGEPTLEDSVEADEAAPRRGRAARRGGSRRAAADDEVAPRFEPGEGSLEDRVAALEREVVTLRRALAMRGRVEIASGSTPESIADDPVLEQEVRGIVEEEREREREREMERRRDRFEELRTETLDELVKVAGLSDDQRTTIDELWSSEADRMLPLMMAARSGDKGFGEVREEARTIRQETDDAVRAMLSDEQFESYEELRPRGPGGRGGPRGGRDDRPSRGPEGDPPAR